MQLTAAAVIICALAIVNVCFLLVIRYGLSIWRETVGTVNAQMNRLNADFIRALDTRARREANATNDAFAVVVLDEIDQHRDKVNAALDAQSAKAEKGTR